jgi:cobalt-zinc-cadmium resistance protein CzcA
MIDALLRGSFRRPGLTLVVVGAACAVGAVSLGGLRRDVFPDLAAPIFNVIVQNAAMSAEELELGIAVPLESALAGLPGVQRIRSVNQLGVTQVTVEFDADADAVRSRQFVAERVGQVASRLPPGTEPPFLSSLTGRLNEIMELTLEADAGVADLMTLRELAEFDVRARLLAVPGVAAVEALGGWQRQVQVQIDPERMSARGVTLDDVLHAVEGANAAASGGLVVQGSSEWNVRLLGRASGVEDVRATVVAVREDTPVLLRDVADVVEAPAVRRGIAHRLAGEVVSCRVVKQFGADTVAVSRAVRAAVESLRGSLPSGVRLDVVYDQADLIEQSLGGVERAILLGAALVVAVLIALLGDLRAALVVTLTLPLSVLLAGALLQPFGIGLNTMTLGGLAIAVGLLVDAAIIVVENTVHRLRAANGPARREQALAAALEVARPIAFATLILVAVFAPLFAMSGLEGRMYQPLAAAVVAALAASLALALTLVPLLAGWMLRPAAPGRAPDTWIVGRAKAAYAPALDSALRHPIRLLAVVLLLTGAAGWAATRIGADFMPALDEGAFLVQTLLPPEASLDEVDRANHRIEDALRALPEVEDVVRRTGRSEVTEDPMPHTLSDVLVVLRPGRERSGEELEDALREALEDVPGVASLITTPLGMRIDEGLGGTPADVAVRLFGPDTQVLARLAESARALVAGVEGLADLRAEPSADVPQLRIVVDREAVARVGLTPGDVIAAVHIGLVGEELSQIWVGQRRFDLVVRLADRWRDDLSAFDALLVDGHDGTRIPLGQLARLEPGFGPVAIRREAGTRRVAIEASVVGRDLAGVAGEIESRLAAGLELPPGYFVDVGGRVESQARAAHSLAIAIGIALLAVFVLLVLALDSMAEALLLVATLPSALVGAIAALLLSGETWNVSSLVGLIGLFGIAVQNALVLMAQTRGLLAAGLPFPAALREASLGRLRPKLMTAATAILGLLPLLVLRLHGTEIERPLAVVMTGGLVSSTLFTLLALPAFYALLHQRLRVRGPADGPAA